MGLFNKFNPLQASGNFTNGAGSAPLAGGGATAAGNGVLAMTKLTNLLCPSDDGGQFYPSADTNYGCVTGLPSYRTSYGFSVTNGNPSTTLWSNEAIATRALFVVCSNAQLRDIRDGASNAVAMVETTLEIYDGKTASWACMQHVGGGVNFSQTNIAYVPNQWFCCTWQMPPMTNFRAGRVGEWGSPGSVPNRLLLLPA